MFKILTVTNRKLCGDFEARLKLIAAASPDAIVLREKDLSSELYADLARKVKDICGVVPLILNKYADAARSLGEAVLLPFNDIAACGNCPRGFGVSCHSIEEAKEAERAGCAFIVAGHIFKTACKDAPPRGTEFLKGICRSVSVPVYAIGGINKDNIGEVAMAGASGACVMSGAMTAPDVCGYISELRKNALCALNKKSLNKESI